jgi:hypothetical protein
VGCGGGCNWDCTCGSRLTAAVERPEADTSKWCWFKD